MGLQSLKAYDTTIHAKQPSGADKQSWQSSIDFHERRQESLASWFFDWRRRAKGVRKSRPRCESWLWRCATRGAGVGTRNNMPYRRHLLVAATDAAGPTGANQTINVSRPYE